MSSSRTMDGPSTVPAIQPRATSNVWSQSSSDLKNSDGNQEYQTEKTEEEILESMRGLLRDWVQLTQPEDVQNDIGLNGKDMDHLFRAVAEVRGKKRLFVCCDGTWQNAVGTIRPMSNVAKLARSIYRVGGDGLDCGTLGGVPQLAYYSSGIGGNAIVKIDGVFAAATGKGFTNTVLSAYCFVSNNYNGVSQRDEIILVGYSRGAFAMRCLAQFISDVGLLRRSGLSHLGMFWELWLGDKTGDEPKWENRKDELTSLFFPDEDVAIKVLAEWDPVKSLIWSSIQGKKLANMTKTVPKKVKNAFVAISLNEKRQAFKPVMWEKYEEGQNVRQCAFLGGHSDIGGGSIDAGLSTISLFWMVASIQNACDAWFDNNLLSQFILPEKVRIASRLRWLPRKKEICLTTQALSKGNVTELFFLWRLLFSENRSRIFESVARQGQTVSARAGQEEQAQEEIEEVEVQQMEGRQGETNSGGTDQKQNIKKEVNVNCELEIHKTVQWILEKWKQSESPSRFRRIVNRILKIRSGKSVTALKSFIYDGDKWKLGDSVHCLKEAELMQQELDMVKEWREAADKTQSSLEVLRSRKREAADGEGNSAILDPSADGLCQNEVLEYEENKTRPDDEIFRDATEWHRWRVAVENESTMNKEASLIKYLGPLYENEREDESENGLPNEPENEAENELENESEIEFENDFTQLLAGKRGKKRLTILPREQSMSYPVTRRSTSVGTGIRKRSLSRGLQDGRSSISRSQIGRQKQGAVRSPGTSARSRRISL